MKEYVRIENNVERMLNDRGLGKDHQDQAVRQLLYHLYIAIDIYRYMTQTEKNKAGYWYRIFKGTFTLRNFLKERKRKREKEKSPLHPSYKVKEREYKEKVQENTLSVGRDFSNVSEDLTNRRNAFRQQCLDRIEKYDETTLAAFYNYWSEENSKSGKMRFEFQKTWNIDRRLARWANSGFTADDKAARIRLSNAKRRQDKEADTLHQQQGMNAEREDENARLEREIAERKQGAVSYEEYLKMKDEKIKMKN